MIKLKGTLRHELEASCEAMREAKRSTPTMMSFDEDRLGWLPLADKLVSCKNCNFCQLFF